MGSKAIGLTFLCLWFSTGCSTSPGYQASWMSRQGGILLEPLRQERVNGIARRLVISHPELPTTVRILNSKAVCAYGFADGTLFVTRGLVDRADDEVIAAALAHELGHLLGDGHVRQVVSIKGCNDDLGAEGRADAYGIELLRAENLPPDSMVRMLSIVRDSNSLPPSCIQAMDQRIEWLKQSASGQGHQDVRANQN
jgi:predicted Zn-dependent protease